MKTLGDVLSVLENAVKYFKISQSIKDRIMKLLIESKNSKAQSSGITLIKSHVTNKDIDGSNRAPWVQNLVNSSHPDAKIASMAAIKFLINDSKMRLKELRKLVDVLVGCEDYGAQDVADILIESKYNEIKYMAYDLYISLYNDKKFSSDVVLMLSRRFLQLGYRTFRDLGIPWLLDLSANDTTPVKKRNEILDLLSKYDNDEARNAVEQVNLDIANCPQERLDDRIKAAVAVIEMKQDKMPDAIDIFVNLLASNKVSRKKSIKWINELLLSGDFDKIKLVGLAKVLCESSNTYAKSMGADLLVSNSNYLELDNVKISNKIETAEYLVRSIISPACKEEVFKMLRKILNYTKNRLDKVELACFLVKWDPVAGGDAAKWLVSVLNDRKRALEVEAIGKATVALFNFNDSDILKMASEALINIIYGSSGELWLAFGIYLQTVEQDKLKDEAKDKFDKLVTFVESRIKY